MKDKKKQKMKDIKYLLNPRGRPVARGACTECGTTIYKILSTSDAQKLKDKGVVFKDEKKGGARKSRKSRSRKSRSRKSRK